VAPYEIQKFNIEIAKKEIGKILNVIWNLQNLVNKNENDIEVEDKWIISKLNSAVKTYEENLEKFESNVAMREISEFILNDLSRSYVQMTRDKENGKIVLECLETILKLLAPVSPFITEKIWQNLRAKRFVKEESVHLCDWPEYKKEKIDLKLEKKFEEVKKYVELGMFERDKAKIGLRWPLGSATILGENKLTKDIQAIIAKQLNVKKIEYVSSKENKVELDTKITPELEAEGYAREFARKVQTERKNKGLKKSDLIVLRVSTDKILEKMLVKNLNFLLGRTNSSKIDFIDEKSMKNKINFEIRGKKVSIELE
jgi:isoleucyl-tRNA synthetase